MLEPQLTPISQTKLGRKIRERQIQWVVKNIIKYHKEGMTKQQIMERLWLHYKTNEEFDEVYEYIIKELEVNSPPSPTRETKVCP